MSVRKAAATAIAKLETDADGINERSNKRWLLLPLNLRDCAIGSRHIRSGGTLGATRAAGAAASLSVSRFISLSLSLSLSISIHLAS